MKTLLAVGRINCNYYKPKYIKAKNILPNCAIENGVYLKMILTCVATKGQVRAFKYNYRNSMSLIVILRMVVAQR